MFKFASPAICSAAVVAAVVFMAPAAFAQTAPQPMLPTADSMNDDRDDIREGRGMVRTEQPTRLNRRSRQPAPPSPEALVASAQGLVDTLRLPCQVTEAAHRGTTADGAEAYEAICASGPGYMLIGQTPPSGADCLVLAGSAVIERERDPTIEAGSQCTLPANLDHLGFIRTFAREAGVACEVNEAMAISLNRYDIGCDGPGYWIEKTEAGWTVTPCLTVKYDGRTCRFTTEAELHQVWRNALAGSPAADCPVADSRRMGVDAAGNTVYEVKCTEQTGFIARLKPDQSLAALTACADAAHIAGGCRLSRP